jgi:hypothetical protein
MQSMIANLIIVDDPSTALIVDAGTPRERPTMVYRLTLNVGGVAFELADTRAVDLIEAADTFAARLRVMLCENRI